MLLVIKNEHVMEEVVKAFAENQMTMLAWGAILVFIFYCADKYVYRFK